MIVQPPSLLVNDFDFAGSGKRPIGGRNEHGTKAIMRQTKTGKSNVVQSAIRNVLASRRRLSPVTDEIGSMIVLGELKEGEALSERMFGIARNISRTSFREAIKVLEGKGLVRR